MSPLAHDANGNTLTDAQGRSFSWDFENRLTQVVNPGVGTTTFRYDPLGRRIQKSSAARTTNYLYDGANPIGEVDNAGNVLARYTQGAGIDQSLSELRSGATSYYEQDASGTVTSLSDGAGVLANTYTYDSFGKLSASTGSITNPFQYAGREWDSETGVYYYRARYYDPSIGRFTSEDLLTGGGASKYAYSMNNPTNRIDPSGLRTIVVVFWNNPENTGFLGEHSGVYVSKDGHPILYDPSGDSRIGPDRHPPNDIFENEDANLSEYLGNHGQQVQGTYAEIFVFDTTDQEESEIANRIRQLGSPGWARCASAVSYVLHGIGPFRNLQQVQRPSALAQQLRVLEQPEILRRSIESLSPKPPANWEQMR